MAERLENIGSRFKDAVQRFGSEDALAKHLRSLPEAVALRKTHAQERRNIGEELKRLGLK